MPRQPAKVEVPLIVLERGTGISLQKQLFDSIRKAILSGILLPGKTLPSTRLLSSELGVSRNTVLWTYEQLSAEGYVESRPRAGTRVAHLAPDHLLKAQAPISRAQSPPVAEAESAHKLEISIRHPRECPVPFAPGSPEVDESFRRLWSRLSTQQYRRKTRELYDFGSPQGYMPLRRQITAYLAETRGVVARPEQVIVVAATQQAFNLILRTLLKRNERIAVEEPGHLGLRSSCEINEVEYEPIPVDKDGLLIHGLKRSFRLICVSPSCQYPTGVTLSLTRRLFLLAWAQRHESWIVEYDYVSAFRYSSRPLLSLQGLDRVGRVIYVGTFSETLFPSLRIAYLVVPPTLIRRFASANEVFHGFPPLLQQATLAKFIEDGHLASHVRRMRKIYLERYETMLRGLETLNRKISIQATDAALHILVHLSDRVSDVEIAAKGQEMGLELAPLSQLYAGRVKHNGFLLGYAAFSPNSIVSGMKKFEALLKRTV